MEECAARVALFDGFELTLGAWHGAPSVDLPRSVQRLVAYLALSRRPARTAVGGQLWPDVPEAQAHSSLRSALWRLHKLAPGLVEASSGGLALAPGVRVDVRQLASWAHRVLDPREDVSDLRMPDTGTAGELLPGWYDDWVLLERERLRQLRMHMLDAWADKLGRAGRHGEAVEAAHAAVRADPLRETPHRVLVRLHLAEGNLAEALRAYESFRALLLEEVGVEPSTQFEALVSGLRRPHPVRALGAAPRRCSPEAASGRAVERR